ncbi:MAG: alpha/beta hydrolase [Myxococcota bacterium]
MAPRAPSSHGAPPLPGDEIRLDDGHGGDLLLYHLKRDELPRTSPLLLLHSINAAASAYEVRPLYLRLAPSRPTYALDLPGFGGSDRSPRPYTPRLYTDAIHAAVAHIQGQHPDAAVDALALSLSCEFLARAATENPRAFRTLALVSPTGLAGTRRWEGPPLSTRGSTILHRILTMSWWRRGLFGLLTRPRVVRYFLARTFGTSTIDEGLWAYAVQTARQPNAEHAPLTFAAGLLFSADITSLYEGLTMPVWISHGVRGDFTNYRGLDRLRVPQPWSRAVFETGALPHFELPDPFVAAYTEFLEQIDGLR